MSKLSEKQLLLVQSDTNQKIYLSGKYGCGKTTAAAERVRFLLENAKGWPDVLVFTPTRTLGAPYKQITSDDGLRPTVTTYNSFVQHALELFWPLISDEAGFAFPRRKPFFLTIETAQVWMEKIVSAKIRRGYFSDIGISNSRLFNQVVISMHKCASADIPYETYAERMKHSWCGDKKLSSIFDQTQECGMEFRRVCRENNLLDYALQLETFNKHLLERPEFRDWLNERQLHFVFDNAEEEVPVAHHLAHEILKYCASALIISDERGGFRDFLGCDPRSAIELGLECPEQLQFTESFICSPAIEAMDRVICEPSLNNEQLLSTPRPAFSYDSKHQYSAMIRQAAADIAELIRTYDVDPAQIVIVAPLVTDLLYTEMDRGLRERGINAYLHRPSRPLINEPITRALLTFCALTLPETGLKVRLLDIAHMLQVLIPALDPIRGQLLVSRAFKPDHSAPTNGFTYRLKPMAELSAEAHSRIPDEIADRFDFLRLRIEQYRAEQPRLTPDILLERLFAEVLLRPGFARGDSVTLGVKKVIESAAKFRRLTEEVEKLRSAPYEDQPTWADFFSMVQDGMVSAYYYEEQFAQPKGTVLVSLASAYLSLNRVSDYQIWLNAGSPQWWERFYGQLTNDEVLSTRWTEGEEWNALSTARANNEHMIRQISGLLRHCRKQVRIYASEVSEGGLNQRSRLLYLLSDLARRVQNDKPTEPTLTAIPRGFREDSAPYSAEKGTGKA